MSENYRKVIDLLKSVGHAQSFKEIKRDTPFKNLYKSLTGREKIHAKRAMIEAIKRDKEHRVEGLESNDSNNDQLGGRRRNTRRNRRNRRATRKNRK